MRKWFKRITPDRENLLANRWIRPVAHRLSHPDIWHFHRRNVARGVALGLFVGFLLPIGQIVAAALLSASARANLLVATVATLVTNPFTFPPIYYAAFRTGSFVLNPGGDAGAGAMPVAGGEGASMMEMLTGASLQIVLGLSLFATVSAVVGFGAVHLAWQLSLARQWRRRTRGGKSVVRPEDQGR